MFSMRVDDDVTLELAEMHHAQAIYDLIERNREHLRPWMPWADTTTSVADTVAFLTFVRGEYAAGRQFHLNLRYRGEIVGGIGMHAIDTEHLTAEIGYWIDAGYEGRGIVTRATAALTTAAFEEMGMVRVTIRADVANERSRGVPERLGYQQEGVMRAHKRIQGRSVDHVFYGMLAAEWDPGTLRGNDAGRT